METLLELRHPGGVTPIVVGPSSARPGGFDWAAHLDSRTVFAVAAPRPHELHPGALDAVAAAAGRLEVLATDDGEEAKEVAGAERLWRRMLELGGKRDSVVVALGGGTIGDLAGFVAGAFLRGVGWIALPTTLLAQVDAAIGGKTGINLPAAKNSVGLFHHPLAVVCDTSFLTTLPAAELRSGLMEVVKMAALLDLELLALVEAELEALLAGDAELLGRAVAGAAAAKIRIVHEDPGDRGLRGILNFGHTLGHALESVAGYGALRHGEAVGHGMRFALRLARRRGLDAESAARLEALIERAALPPLPALEVDALEAAIGRDKKARESGVEWVLPAALGEGAEMVALPAADVRRELAAFLAT